MELSIEKMRHDMRLENRRFFWQAVASIGGAFTAGAAVVGLLLRFMGKV